MRMIMIRVRVLIRDICKIHAKIHEAERLKRSLYSFWPIHACPFVLKDVHRLPMSNEPESTSVKASRSCEPSVAWLAVLVSFSSAKQSLSPTDHSPKAV